MRSKGLENSIETLKILYMVVVGFALSEGLQEFVNSRTRFQIPSDPILWVFFIIFVSTVIRFAHGAMRHFDHYYVEEHHHVQWKGQPLWDLVILVWDGFVFFLLAFTLRDQNQFIFWYLILLLSDTVWILGIFLCDIKQAFRGTELKWMIANAVVLLSTGVPWYWLLHQSSPLWLLIIFFVGVAAHTVMDYGLNWEFYFGPLIANNRKGK